MKMYTNNENKPGTDRVYAAPWQHYLLKTMLVVIIAVMYLLCAYSPVYADDASYAEDIFFRRTLDITYLDPEDPTYDISYQVIPEDAENKEIDWSSDDEDIAEIDSNGHVTIKAEGEVIFTATLHNGKTKAFLLLIREKKNIMQPRGIWADQELYNLAVGEQAQLSISTDPMNSRVDLYEYESDDQAVVKAEDGVLTAVGTGSTKVHVKTTTYADAGSGWEEDAVHEVTVDVNVFDDKDSPIVNITDQPGDMDVEYPDGAEFEVKVDHPENVKSYQWEARVYSFDDNDFNMYQLDGTSAQTNKLEIPSTEYQMHDHYFRCIITDIRGKKHVSEEAVMRVTNNTELKPVLYVGEYAIEPGETLDAEEKGIGSGTAAFDENALEVTFQDLDIDNTSFVYDSYMAPSFGVYLFGGDTRPFNERIEYYMHFNGECRINNRFFDPDDNSAGVCVNAYFSSGERDDKSTLIIDGDVTTMGGKNSIYVGNGNLEIAGNIKTIPKDTVYNDSISAEVLMIDENAKLDIHCCGAALESRVGDIRIYDGAEIRIHGIVPHISKGLAAVSLIKSAYSIYCKGAEINISGKAVPETILPYKSSVAMYNGISCVGTLSLDDTDLSIDMSTRDWPDRFANNFNGFAGNEFSSLTMTNGSTVDINIDTPEIFGASGLSMGQNIMMDEGSSIKTYVRAMQRAIGISIDGRLKVEDATIETEAEALPFEGSTDYEARGIVAGEMDIDITNDTDHIGSKVNRGSAFYATHQEKIPDPLQYDPSYVAEMISLKNKAKISVPKSGVISCYSISLEDVQRKAETIYDPKSADAPAKEIYIGTKPVVKKANTLKASGKKVTLKSTKLKKKAQYIKRAKAVTVKKAKGKLTYKLMSVKKAGSRKFFKVNSKTGKITVRKGLKKGTYKLRIRVKAAGTKVYKPKTRYVTVTVKVR